MDKPESVQENKIYKILWDIETTSNHSILIRRPGVVVINKTNVYKFRPVDFTIPANNSVKIKESDKLEEYLKEF